jgi:hypothetical protein
MGMITAMAVLPAGDRPELCDACFVGLRLVDDGPVAVDVCWLPLLEEDVTVTTTGGVVPWAGDCVTIDVNTWVDVGTGAVVTDVVTGGGAAVVVGVVAGVVGVVDSTDVGDVAGAEADDAGVVGVVPPAVDMVSIWGPCQGKARQGKAIWTDEREEK